MAPEKIRVAVLGPGGVGGLLAALLARAGNEVQVLAGEDTARVIAAAGIRLESRMFGDFNVALGAATRLDGPVDACFIAVKNTQLAAALGRVPSAALGDGLVVPFLNGIDHVDLLRRAYPSANVAPATIRVATARVGAGLIRHSSPFASIEIAEADTNESRVASLTARLRAAGLDVKVRRDETAMLWDKLSFLAPFALVTTHERANAGVIRTRRRADTLAVIAEVAAVAAAEGAVIDREAVTRYLDSVPETMESSMQHDQVEGQALEIDAIGGAVVRRAARAGVEVPVTARLVEELRARG
jgi:2-dehydropantoate 2-reductase